MFPLKLQKFQGLSHQKSKRLRDTRFWLRGPGPRLRSFLLSPCPAHASMIGLGPGLIAKNGLGKIEATGTPKNALLGGDDCATGMMGRALRESVQI